MIPIFLYMHVSPTLRWSTLHCVDIFCDLQPSERKKCVSVCVSPYNIVYRARLSPAPVILDNFLRLPL